MFSRVQLQKPSSAPKPAVEPRPTRENSIESPAKNRPQFSYSLAGIRIFARGEDQKPSEGRPAPQRLPFPLQAKLMVGTVNDPLEQEADHVAEQVMRMPEPGAASVSLVRQTGAGTLPKTSGDGSLQRKCDCGGTCNECKKTEHGQPARVQMKAGAANVNGGFAAPPSVHEVLRSPGQALDAATRAFMEPRFGHDFSRVRLHLGDKAGNSAKAVGARAYAVGRNVVFGPGEYVPGTEAGRRLLSHELAHSLQQSSEAGLDHLSQTDGTIVARQPLRKDPDAEARREHTKEHFGNLSDEDLRREWRRRKQFVNSVHWKKHFDFQTFQGIVEERLPAESNFAGPEPVSLSTTAYDMPLAMSDEDIYSQNPAKSTEKPVYLNEHEKYRLALKSALKEREKYEHRRTVTKDYFQRKLWSEFALRDAYEHALQLLLDGNDSLDFETMEEIVQQNAPNAAWHEKARQKFLAKLQAQTEAREAKRRIGEQAQERQKLLPGLPAYWQNQMRALSGLTQSWPEEAQQVAQGLLWKWYELRKQAFPLNPAQSIPGVESGIETTIRKDLVAQFEQVLRAADKKIQEECAEKPPYWMEKIHGDPCVSLFVPFGRAESALSFFETRLKIFRDEDGIPYNSVFYWVQEYMHQQVPTSMAGRYLELLQARAQLGQALSMAVGPSELPGEAAVGEAKAGEAALGRASPTEASSKFPPAEIEPLAPVSPAEPPVEAGVAPSGRPSRIGGWMRSKVLEFAMRGADVSEVAPRIGAGGAAGERPVAGEMAGPAFASTPKPEPVTQAPASTPSVQPSATEMSAPSSAQQEAGPRATVTEPASPAPTAPSQASAGGSQASASRTSGPQVETLPRSSRPFQPHYTAGPTVEDVSARYRYRTYEKNGKIYKQASGRLGMPREVVEHRDPSSQARVSSRTGDDAGHLLGNRFGASGDVENLSRQNWIANRFGNYKTLENMWADMRHRGIEIDVWVTDVTRAGEDRPFRRNVKWTEYYLDGMEIEHEIDFANTTTQESRAAGTQGSPTR